MYVCVFVGACMCVCVGVWFGILSICCACVLTQNCVLGFLDLHMYTCSLPTCGFSEKDYLGFIYMYMYGVCLVICM